MSAPPAGEQGPEGFVHLFIPGSGPLTLLLLHGTGADERDLIPLGRRLAPEAALLSPRGKVLENGMPRFFRRLAEGVFDLDDLRIRTTELASFIARAREVYGFDPAGLVAVGFSNGANMAASLLLLAPGLLAAAVLFRAVLPLEPEQPPRLDGVPVFLSAGRNDPFAPVERVESLARVLTTAGAELVLRWDEGGHGIDPPALEAAREWLAGWAVRLKPSK
jgi:predicted esterase